MSDDKIKDIYMEENNIFISNGDFIKVDGIDLLKQNIIRRLTTPRGAIFFDKEFGSEIYKWIKKRDVSLRYAELHIKEVLTECDEIDPRTINVKAMQEGESLMINITFELWNVGLTEKLNIALKKSEIEVRFIGG